MASESFGFAVVNAGSERAIKMEMARLRPSARLAFSRPGLVTWKDTDVDESFGAGSVIARVRGLSLGRATTIEQARQLIASRPAQCLHVFARDESEDGPTAAGEEAARQVRDALAMVPSTPVDGDEVVDVVVDTDAMFVGVHRHCSGAWLVPGGRPSIELDPDAPSRAYRKLEEALAWSGLEPLPGSVGLELGAAPGGAALALVRRGVSVVAVDPASMDPRVMTRRGPRGARVTHVQKPAGELVPSDVPEQTSLLLLDVNFAPAIALRYFARAASIAHGARLAVLTLKVNDDSVLASMPDTLEHVRSLGFEELQATRLPSNRSEICVVARRAPR